VIGLGDRLSIVSSLIEQGLDHQAIMNRLLSA
jgi:hypothetical protein